MTPFERLEKAARERHSWCETDKPMEQCGPCCNLALALNALDQSNEENMVVCDVCKEDDERLLGPDKRFRLYSLQAFVHSEVPIDGGIGATKSLDLCRKCLVRAMSAVERELEVEWGNIQ